MSWWRRSPQDIRKEQLEQAELELQADLFALEDYRYAILRTEAKIAMNRERIQRLLNELETNNA